MPWTESPTVVLEKVEDIAQKVQFSEDDFVRLSQLACVATLTHFETRVVVGTKSVVALDRFPKLQSFRFMLSAPDGAAMTLAFLMTLKEP